MVVLTFYFNDISYFLSNTVDSLYFVGYQLSWVAQSTNLKPQRNIIHMIQKKYPTPSLPSWNKNKFILIRCACFV